VALAGRLLAIGGRSGNAQVSAPESYDPTSGHWTDLPPLPHARNHLSAYISGPSACVTGGREPATSTRTDCLDPATSTWQPGPTLPEPTSGAAAGLLGTMVVVAGGEPADESKLVTDVQEWRDGTWSTEPMLAAAPRAPACTRPTCARPSADPKRVGHWCGIRSPGRLARVSVSVG